MEQKRIYRCAFCNEDNIVESRTQEPSIGFVDVLNCDLSTYSNHKITGGKLFAERPEPPFSTHSIMQEKPVGGICDECQTYKFVKRLQPFLLPFEKPSD